MRLFGREITIVRTKAAISNVPQAVGDRGWISIVRESFAGAWQRNIELRTDTVLSYQAVYACISLISADIAKLEPLLMEEDRDGVWLKTTSPAFSPVLRKPNHYQNRIKFYQHWLISKLVHGNTYVLKVRDNRQVVTELYVLDPNRVRVLVAPDGAIYYELRRDDLSGLTEEVVVIPASEIIHDLMTPLFHPLVGVSPIYACGLAAMQGLNIQQNSAKFFANGSMPGGILTAPAHIDDDTAKRIKEHWESEYKGENVGKVAVLGDALKFEQMAIAAIDAQLIEQLKWSAETVCSCYKVPSYMVLGTAPTYNNVEALNQQYYSQCLQELIENIELCLLEGLSMESKYKVHFDLDGLIRMDTPALYKSIAEGVVGGFLTPNEGRKLLNRPKVKGGDTPYLQQQNYSLEALAKRDAQDDPFKKATPPASATPAPTPAPAKSIEDDEDEDLIGLAAEFRKALTELPPLNLFTGGMISP